MHGLAGAGEWHVLKSMMPDVRGLRVLDLGCGFGWHCMWAIENGAKRVVGVDISEKMLHEAREKDQTHSIEYLHVPIEDVDMPHSSFDVVISSLAFHYLSSFEHICQKVYDILSPGGSFLFSVEHPIFTAEGSQDWHYDESGERDHWPVDRYFEQGERTATFLGEKVVKYHKTMTTYINGLLQTGFEIKELIEPEPDMAMLESMPDMRHELRRPMMLIISASKKLQTINLN